jgi:RNA-directed DNA polymerase
LFDLDDKLSQTANKEGVIYTRYADDITVSGDCIEDLTRFEAIAIETIRQAKSPQLLFNEEKRGVYTKAQRRMVTGLIITPAGKISLGRERKRLISAMLHKVKTNQLSTEKMSKIKGLLGFCLAVEPVFVTRMSSKYGSDTVNRALRFDAPRKRSPGTQ